jgi:hypothetical protein
MQMADTRQLFLNIGRLEPQLGRIIDMLPVAPATARKIWAARLRAH